MRCLLFRYRCCDIGKLRGHILNGSHLRTYLWRLRIWSQFGQHANNKNKIRGIVAASRYLRSQRGELDDLVPVKLCCKGRPLFLERRERNMANTRQNVWALGSDWADPILWYARGVKAMKARALNDSISASDLLGATVLQRHDAARTKRQDQLAVLRLDPRHLPAVVAAVRLSQAHGYDSKYRRHELLVETASATP